MDPRTPATVGDRDASSTHTIEEQYLLKHPVLTVLGQTIEDAAPHFPSQKYFPQYRLGAWI